MSDWIDVNIKMPETKGRWSERDVLCACMYNYEIGRTRDGEWVDMDNKPIDVTHWVPIPDPPPVKDI